MVNYCTYSVTSEVRLANAVSGTVHKFVSGRRGLFVRFVCDISQSVLMLYFKRSLYNNHFTSLPSGIFSTNTALEQL